MKNGQYDTGQNQTTLQQILSLTNQASSGSANKPGNMNHIAQIAQNLIANQNSGNNQNSQQNNFLQLIQ